MYMNQMGKVPLLTREQEVEICKRIEDAEIEMKRIIYGLGFAAKEHIAISEKLLSEPPKERFDRVVVDKQVANRDRHLRNLRMLIKKVRVMDQNVDKKYLSFCKVVQKSRREKLQKEFLKLDKKVQSTFPKFFYKQKVVEEMIVVAGNVHEKFQASLRRIPGWKRCTSPPRPTPQEIEARTLQDRRARIVRAHVARGILQGVHRVETRRRSIAQQAKTHMAEAGSAPTWCPSPRNTPTRGQSFLDLIPGRQHRPHEGCRKIRISPRLQVFDVRHLVDSPGHYAAPSPTRPAPSVSRCT